MHVSVWIEKDIYSDLPRSYTLKPSAKVQEMYSPKATINVLLPACTIIAAVRMLLESSGSL